MKQDPPPRKLAVILHADVVGSTKLVQRDEQVAHERMRDSFRRFSDTISAYGGQTREIRGGAGLFMVAEQCEAELDIHAPPGIPVNTIHQLIDESRNKALDTHPDCALEHENLYWAPGYIHPAEEPLLTPLRRAFEAARLDWRPEAFRSHSDGNLFYQKGSVPVICGPGKLEVAHTRAEHVSLRETFQAAHLYTALIYEACVR